MSLKKYIFKLIYIKLLFINLPKSLNIFVISTQNHVVIFFNQNMVRKSFNL
jgi:hypothetical protein